MSVDHGVNMNGTGAVVGEEHEGKRGHGGVSGVVGGVEEH